MHFYDFLKKKKTGRQNICRQNATRSLIQYENVRRIFYRNIEKSFAVTFTVWVARAREVRISKNSYADNNNNKRSLVRKRFSKATIYRRF